jgi:hypothetical protein
MKNLLLACLAGLLGLGLGERAEAQIYNPPATSPFYRPPVSPYLNLALPGSAGLNYYGLVRPQLATNAALGQLQAQQQALGASLAATNDPYAVGPVTGHSTRFFNYSHYYGNRGGAGAPARPAVATVQPGILGRATPPQAGIGVANPPRATPPAAPAIPPP